MEWWKNGIVRRGMGGRKREGLVSSPSDHYSIIPLFHYFIISLFPFSHYSIIPLFHYFHYSIISLFHYSIISLFPFFHYSINSLFLLHVLFLRPSCLASPVLFGFASPVWLPRCRLLASPVESPSDHYSIIPLFHYFIISLFPLFHYFIISLFLLHVLLLRLSCLASPVLSGFASPVWRPRCRLLASPVASP